jgi:hypothetical protein
MHLDLWVDYKWQQSFSSGFCPFHTLQQPQVLHDLKVKPQTQSSVYCTATVTVTAQWKFKHWQSPRFKEKLFICQKHFLATSPQWMQAKNAPPKAITSFGTSHEGTHTKSKAVFVYRVASSASVTSDRGSSLSSSESEDQSIPRSNDAKGSCMLVWLKWVSLGH